MGVIEKECKVCGGPFTHHNPNTVTCGPICRYENKIQTGQLLRDKKRKEKLCQKTQSSKPA